MTLLGDFLEYCQAVFVEAWQKLFTMFDLLGIIFLIYPQLAYSLTSDVGLIRSVAATIVILSFFFANFSMYHKLADQLSYEADIRLEIVQQNFSYSSGSRQAFRDPMNPHGIDSVGMPDWASLWASIRIANIGQESGQLIWEIDKNRTKLPSLFDLENHNVKFESKGPIAGRKVIRVDFFFDVLFTERDPNTFARHLKSLLNSKQNYQVVLSYKTRRVNSISPSRRLVIKGNFQDFRREICRYWQGHGFEHMVELAS